MSPESTALYASHVLAAVFGSYLIEEGIYSCVATEISESYSAQLKCAVKGITT